MYQVGTAITVHAFHVMPGMDGPEGELHAHDYRIDVVVERAELDEAGMVCDLDVLDAALGALADQLHDADLEFIRPPAAPAVTVEVFARWLHQQLTEPIGKSGGERLSVRVWESETAFGGFSDDVG